MQKLVHRGFEAFISVDDANLEVHRASVSGAVASGWVASEPGRAFKITVHQPRPETHFTLRVHLDGQRVEYLVTPSWQMRTLSADGARPSQTTFTPFVFAAPAAHSPSPSPLDAAEDDEDEPLEPDEATLREIGTIRLEVARVVLGTAYCSDSTRTGGLSPADVLRKRGLGQHHIALGEERAGEPWYLRTWAVTPVDPRKPGPDAVFEFRYRPREFLHANGIIPRAKRAREPRVDQDTPEDEPSAKVARIDAENATPSTVSSEETTVSTEEAIATVSSEEPQAASSEKTSASTEYAAPPAASLDHEESSSGSSSAVDASARDPDGLPDTPVALPANA